MLEDLSLGSVVIFLAGQTAAAIWWASKVTTTLAFVQEKVIEVNTEVKTHLTEKLAEFDSRIREVENELIHVKARCSQ